VLSTFLPKCILSVWYGREADEMQAPWCSSTGSLKHGLGVPWSRDQGTSAEPARLEVGLVKVPDAGDLYQPKMEMVIHRLTHFNFGGCTLLPSRMID
jgi:hypothetical protein